MILTAVVFGAAVTLRTENAQTVQTNDAAASQKKPVYQLLTKADVRQAFKEIPLKPPTNKKIIDEANYNASVARVAGRNGPPEQHRDSDRIFFIKKGAARMRIGGEITDPKETSAGEYRSKSGTGYRGYDEVKIKGGTVLSVPRNIAYQIIAENADVSFIVVRTN